MTGPHQGQPLVTAGESLDRAEAVVIMVHGRGARARGILGMAGEFDAEGVAYLAPQAQRNEWYPQSFLSPVEANEPGRTSGLQAIGDALAEAERAGIPPERVLIMGFSQGGCLATEYVARNPRRYGGLAALSGGLIGEEVEPEDYEGDLAKMPAFFGCSDIDPHIPEERVHESAEVFERLGADVETRLYEGMGHTVNQDELDYVSSMVAGLGD
ncbi:alpha/beta hydrolase [Halovenus salina]|uniref:Alpha/beta hydrolase n=1 Tax=Halovenus salina TaxID=1510225 RepID=A0ABD5VUD3_9EURY|nr:dienelactone hydrolase family protein [Halovenus salina]